METLANGLFSLDDSLITIKISVTDIVVCGVIGRRPILSRRVKYEQIMERVLGKTIHFES